MTKETQQIMEPIEFYDLVTDPVKKYSIMFSKELLKARKEKKMSQDKLSLVSGIPQKTISRIETGKDLPNLGTIIKLVESLEKNIYFKIE